MCREIVGPEGERLGVACGAWHDEDEDGKVEPLRLTAEQVVLLKAWIETGVEPELESGQDKRQ